MRPIDNRLGAALLLVGALCVLIGRSSAAQTSRDGEVAVVAHPGMPINSLTLAEVRQVFLGERQYWNAKLPVVLLIPAPVARERDVVMSLIYQMTESQFKQYWIAKIFRAEIASAPKIVYSNDVESDLVRALPGAIAFMDARTASRLGLKIVRVDGRLPGEQGYLLR
jgi:ABC-type phosphate transport system substrate-binding protein